MKTRKLFKNHMCLFISGVFLGLILIAPSSSAQVKQDGTSETASAVATGDVTVRVYDPTDGEAVALAAQAGLDASWIHGTSIRKQDVSALTLNYLGWAGVITIPPSVTRPGGNSGWVHIAVPTPVIVEGVRAKLSKVLIFYRNTTGAIVNVDVWDGDTRIMQQTTALTGTGLASFDFSTPPIVRWGVGVSINVRGCLFVDPPGCDERTVEIVGAGADFTR